MTIQDEIKALAIFLSGFLTVLLIRSFPADGGGVSLIFVLSVPFFLVLSLGLALFYFWKAKRQASSLYKNTTFSLSLLVIIVLSFMLFPCSETDSPCPCQTVVNSYNISTEYDKIQFNDLFLELKKTNYPKIVAAQKKFKNDVPEKFYFVTYSPAFRYYGLKEYVIYFKDNVAMSNNEDLEIASQNDGFYTFTEIFDNDTIEWRFQLANAFF